MEDLRLEIVDALEGKNKTTKMFERHSYLHNNWKTLTDKEREEFEMIDDYIRSKIDFIDNEEYD